MRFLRRRLHSSLLSIMNWLKHSAAVRSHSHVRRAQWSLVFTAETTQQGNQYSTFVLGYALFGLSPHFRSWRFSSHSKIVFFCHFCWRNAFPGVTVLELGLSLAFTKLKVFFLFFSGLDWVGMHINGLSCSVLVILTFGWVFCLLFLSRFPH